MVEKLEKLAADRLAFRNDRSHSYREKDRMDGGIQPAIGWYGQTIDCSYVETGLEHCAGNDRSPVLCVTSCPDIFINFEI